MKKGTAISICLMLILVSCIPTISSDEPVSRGTIYVDDDASSGWYDATHVKTIQEGIDNASDGFFVFVYSGIYGEQIVLNKTIQLIGENKNNTIIDGGGNSHLITIENDSNTICHFTILNNGSQKYPRCSLIIESNFNIISDMIFNENYSYYSIAIVDSSNNIIKNNTIHNHVILYEASNNSIENNDFKNSGILLEESPDNNIINNLFNNSGIALMYLSDNNTIMNNTMTNGYFGLAIAGSSENTIIKNTITNYSEYGLGFFGYSSENIIHSNIIMGNYYDTFCTEV